MTIIKFNNINKQKKRVQGQSLTRGTVYSRRRNVVLLTPIMMLSENLGRGLCLNKFRFYKRNII